MAPIPSTLDADVQTQIAALERRRKDLQDFQIPRLRQCEGPLATQQQYAAELREDIEAFARQVESLDIAVEDQKSERNRKELRQIVDELKGALARFRKDSRAALLVSKRAIDAKKTSNRDELLRSTVVREKQDLNEKVAEDALMTTSNNVTEALQRTIVLMQGELEKSVLSTQLLDSSTAALRSTSSTHDVLDGLLSTSKYLITALEKSDWIDRLLIIAALAFFILVVLFILKQRLVDRSLRIAFWWTRYIPSFPSSSGSHDQMMDVLAKGSLSSITTELASTVIATVSATAVSAASSVMTSTPHIVPSSTPGPSDPDPISLLEEISLSSSTLLPEALSDDTSTSQLPLASSSTSLPSLSEPDIQPASTSHADHDEL